MENRDDLMSILPYLPLIQSSTSLLWPPQVVEALEALSRGPEHSRVDSGELLGISISELRKSLCLSDERLVRSALHGYARFFDSCMSRVESEKWFREVIPSLANLLLRFPSLMEEHYRSADAIVNEGGVKGKTGLRLLDSQEAGIVFLDQNLIAALLGCSFFCLFPNADRFFKHLRPINFDKLFGSLYDDYNEKQENKIRCIIHYLERISSQMPMGVVSFERKVLPMEDGPSSITYPDTNFWSSSAIPLCRSEVCSTGLIEDQSGEAIEVDFANKYLGGGALRKGCVQEEIRFMINPELIAGKLFFPLMADNEAIEIVGAERFSSYTGYGSSFCFSGDYMDEKDVDSFQRRKIRIVAIDALRRPGKRQYEEKFLLREVNKAFCGFLDQSKHKQYKKLLQEHAVGSSSGANKSTNGGSTTSDISFQLEEQEEEEIIGIATGNWGCGAYGGDPEIKSMLQWLAASQAMRPFILYYTCGLDVLRDLDRVVQWVSSQKRTVGDLWNMLVEYSRQRLERETKVGFFMWLLPPLSGNKEILEMPNKY